MRLLRGTVPETSGPSQPPFHDQATPQPQRRQGQVGVLNGTQGQISCLPQPGWSLQLVSTGRLLKSSNDTLGAPSAPLDKGWPLSHQGTMEKPLWPDMGTRGLERARPRGLETAPHS